MPSKDAWRAYIDDLSSREDACGEKRRYSTINRNVYGVAKLFDALGMPSPTRTTFHKQLMRDLARREQRRPKKARPMMGPIVHDLVASYGCATYASLRDAALTTIEVNRGFRASTVVGVQIENIEFEARGVVIGLRDEKTNSTGELQKVAIAHTKTHRSCVPCILSRLIAYYRACRIESGPLFRRVDRWGRIGDQGLAPHSVTYLLRKGLARLGVPDPDSYSSHSYRHGVVKTAVLKGLSNAEIMQITLHRSVRGLAPYIAETDPWRNAPTFSLLDEVIVQDKNPSRGWIHGISPT
jgi:integrase